MNEHDNRTSEESAPSVHPKSGPATHRPLVGRHFGWKVLAVVGSGMLVLVLAFIAYLWWATRTPSGSGPEFRDGWASVVRWQPDNVAARLELGYAYRQTGENAKAIEQFDEVLKREPFNAAALYNRGMAYLAVGNPTRAEEDLWKVLEAYPDHTQAAIALGEYYAEKGQYRSLLVAVRPVLRAQPKVARLQYLTGLGYEHTGHPDWAGVRYKMALELDPNLLEARRGLERLAEDR